MKPAKGIEKWGRDTAKERYSASPSKGGDARPNGDALSSAPTYQAPQDPIDAHSPGYDNDAKGWVRGEGPKSPYPTFDKGREGKA